MSTALLGSIDDHQDIVAPADRFVSVSFRGDVWDLSHLNPFALRVDLDDSLTVDVVVLFSCHCFTHNATKDQRPSIPPDERYWDNRDARVLNAERFRLSKQWLPQLVRELPTRHIRVADQSRPSFVTMEAADSEGKAVQYAVFFEAKRDAKRAKRMLLRVQSAYPIEKLTNRQLRAGKVRFAVLLRSVYNGRPIRG